MVVKSPAPDLARDSRVSRVAGGTLTWSTDRRRQTGQAGAKATFPSRRKFLLRPAAPAGLLALGVLALLVQGSAAIALLAGGTQLLVGVMIMRSAERILSLVSLFVAAWLAMFTLRLMQIALGPDPLTNHPVVVSASTAEIAYVSALCTLGLIAFAVGVYLARRLVPSGQVPDVRLSRLSSATLYYACIVAAFLLGITHVSSGLLINVAQLYLFGIGFASYESAASGRPFGMELVATLAACVLAIIFGAKEYAVLPVVAWSVGHFSVRRRFVTGGLFAVGLLGVVFYIGVQSQRVATALGDTRHDFIGATVHGLGEYDYPTGLRRHKTGIQIPLNAFAGITSRVRGADSLFVLHARIPERAEFQRGRTIWQPAVSVVPGAAKILNLEFDQLSLGRYFNQTFWTLRPGRDPSSQAPTVPGDFYLNFGLPGVAIGLMLFGLLYGGIDRRAPVRSATSAALFGYAAIQMISIDRNVAYVLVTGAIRYGLGLLLIALLRHAVLHRTRPSISPSASIPTLTNFPR